MPVATSISPDHLVLNLQERLNVSAIEIEKIFK